MEIQRTRGAAAGSGGADIFGIAHDQLVQQNGEALVPQLALENISVEKGTWRANPNGTMDTTWQLRQHQVAPRHAIHISRSSLHVRRLQGPDSGKSGSSADAVDLLRPRSVHVLRSLVIGLRRCDPGGGALPDAAASTGRHVQDDKAALVNSPRWSTEFVGLGPYRVVDWDVGNRIEFVRFDEYSQGRPPLDRVIVREIPDANSMVANVLAARSTSFCQRP